MALYSPKTYSRSEMVELLTAMPLEEKRWTLNYLQDILFISLNKPQTTRRGKAEPVGFKQFHGIIGETGETDRERLSRILHERFGA